MILLCGLDYGLDSIHEAGFEKICKQAALKSKTLAHNCVVHNKCLTYTYLYLMDCCISAKSRWITYHNRNISICQNSDEKIISTLWSILWLGHLLNSQSYLQSHIIVLNNIGLPTIYILVKTFRNLLKAFCCCGSAYPIRRSDLSLFLSIIIVLAFVIIKFSLGLGFLENVLLILIYFDLFILFISTKVGM